MPEILIFVLVGFWLLRRHHYRCRRCGSWRRKASKHKYPGQIFCKRCGDILTFHPKNDKYK